MSPEEIKELQELGDVKIEQITQEQFDRYKFLCQKWLADIAAEMEARTSDQK